MRLYFEESTKLRRNLYYILSIITIAIAIYTYELKDDIFLGLMYAFVVFVFLRIIVNYFIQKKDNGALNLLLSTLYDKKNPKLFLKEVEAKINFEELSKSQITSILIHKAIAKCYNDEISEAKELLNYIEKKTENENTLLKLSFYHIMFEILDEKIAVLDDSIAEFKELLESKKTDNIVGSNLKSEKEQLKYLDSFENKIIECELLAKIVRSKPLSAADDDLLKALIEGEDSSLRYEMLHYYAAVNRVSVGDDLGAIEFLQKIESLPVCTTVIQSRAIALLNKIK